MFSRSVGGVTVPKRSLTLRMSVNEVESRTVIKH
jgi:hypothetical protein